MKILFLNLSDSKPTSLSIVSFFQERNVSVQVVKDVALFETLAKKKKEFAMAVVLVSSNKSHLIAKSKRQVPTTVYQPHTFSHKKLSRFYSEQGEADG